ncbi:MAG: hypothetical protein EPO32_12090 [Anaerolineae bacterium]|nr:MAG: hypothetical protein EPO32_12090 [Anaerolineae bacterium]
MKRIYSVLGALVAIAALVGVNYALFSGKLLGLSPEILATLESDDRVTVTIVGDNEQLVMVPAGAEPRAGLILYPEGRMDVRTYGPVARRLAGAGYRVVFLSRRLEREGDLAAEYARIEAIINAQPEVETWFVGGHTFGGTIGVGYALSHPDRVAGLVLWAVRLDSGDADLSGSDLPVLYVYGTLDDENVDLMARVGPRLPAEATIVSIEGGNRVQFGSYGPMAADVGAGITPEEQQVQAAAATVEFLTGLGY